jgi:hypothetical protein
MPFWKLNDNSHAPAPPAANGRRARADGSVAYRLKAGMVNAPLTGAMLEIPTREIVVSVPMTEAPNYPELSNPELNGLVKLSDRNGVDIRPTLLRVVTDLYLQNPTHTEEESQRYERLALKLIEHVDAKTRATIAQKIAGYPNAPAAVRQRLLKEYIKVKAPDEAVETSAAKTSAAKTASTDTEPTKPAPAARPKNKSTTSSNKAAADELSELFFASNAEERRLILLNLSYAPITPAEPIEPAAAQSSIQQLEAAALNHRIETFARELERVLSISRTLAHRMVTDPSGEPIVIAASALGMPAAVLQRILLCINPVISQSVQRVYDLVLLYEDLKAASALRMIAIWQAVHRAEKKSVATPPAAAPCEPHPTISERRAAFSVVRPKIRWDQHTQNRKAETA